MSIDIHLLDGRVCSSMGGHGTIGSFVRVIGIIQVVSFFEGFELLDDTIDILWIVFRDPCFNPGGVKEYHGSLLLINTLADWFRQVNKVIEHGL